MSSVKDYSLELTSCSPPTNFYFVLRQNLSVHYSSTYFPSLKYVFRVSLKLLEYFTNSFFWCSRAFTQHRIFRNIFFKTNQTRWGQCTSVCTYSAILVLIFLNDIVDCVQQLFYGARYVSAGNQERIQVRASLKRMLVYWQEVDHTSSNITFNFRAKCPLCQVGSKL